MTTTPTTDPGAIDLEAIKRLIGKPGEWADRDDDDVRSLIAAVEALRARVAELKIGVPALRKWYEEEKARAEAAKARITELELAALVKNTRHGKALGDRALAAEACMVEMAGALAEARPVVFHATDPTHQSAKHETRRRILGIVDTALSATPAEALERARAEKECVTMLRRLIDLSRRENWPTNADFEPAEDALAKLDALGKE